METHWARRYSSVSWKGVTQLWSAKERIPTEVTRAVNSGSGWRIKDQLDVTCYFISLLMCSTCFGLQYIHFIGVVSVLQAEACNTDTTTTQPHRNSNTHRTKNNTTNVAIQENSCKLLMMDILKSETCWAHKKWNKIASDIMLVFYSATITMMHGPTNLRFRI